MSDIVDVDFQELPEHEPSWLRLQHATALRKELLAAGFTPTPCNGKAIHIPGWQEIVVTNDLLDTWETERPDHLNSGVRNDTTPTIDIDITHPEAAAAVEALAREHFEERGRILVRFGQAPKRAIPLRTDEPFKKIVRLLIAPDGSTQKIEILASGQQIVVAGIHPDTKKPYSWHGGEPGTIKREELPCVCEADMRDFVDAAAALLVSEFGFRLKEESKPKASGDSGARYERPAGIREKAYAQAALEGCVAELAAAASGSRNELLNKFAFRLGRMVVRGWIDRATVEAALTEAMQANGYTAEDGIAAVKATLKSGLDDGEKEPHPDLGEQKNDDSGESTTGELPDLVINESDPPATAKALADLIAKRDDFLFNGNTVVRIAVEADCLPRALEVTIEAIRVYAHEICRPVKLRKVKGNTERISVPLSKDIALIYLNGLEGQWNLPRFRGITTAPILANDGSIRIATGFDPATGLWCQNIPNVSIQEQPSERDARNALYRLRFFFRTFPYADSVRMLDAALGVEVTDLDAAIGLDESTFLIALLTAVCRPSLDLAPSYLIRAPGYSGSGSGKGLGVKALCIIGSGSKPAAFTSGHDGEEFDKRLTAALVEAHPAVFLDNFNAKELRSDVLASALTEDPATVRPMGHSKMVPLHTRTFITITGNAVEIAEDMARRTITTNFDTKVENPELRKFQPGFLDQVFASRAELLADALTIWRWGRQNRLTSGKPLGNYERWAQWCRDPLTTLGMRDPIERLAEIKAADPRRRALIAVFDAWWKAHRDDTLKATDLAPEVIEHIDQRAVRKLDGNLQFNRQRVARFLALHAAARVGGYVLEQIKDEDRTRPIALYKLQREAA